MQVFNHTNVAAVSDRVYSCGGNLVMEVIGTFDGGTAKLRRSDTVGGALYDYPDTNASMTANGSYALTCGVGFYCVSFSGHGSNLAATSYLTPLTV